jgi:hypothetical protein
MEPKETFKGPFSRFTILRSLGQLVRKCRHELDRGDIGEDSVEVPAEFKPSSSAASQPSSGPLVPLFAIMEMLPDISNKQIEMDEQLSRMEKAVLSTATIVKIDHNKLNQSLLLIISVRLLVTTPLAATCRRYLSIVATKYS